MDLFIWLICFVGHAILDFCDMLIRLCYRLLHAVLWLMFVLCMTGAAINLAMLAATHSWISARAALDCLAGALILYVMTALIRWHLVHQQMPPHDEDRRIPLGNPWR